MRLLAAFAMALFLTTLSSAQDPVPKGPAPQFGLASAAMKDGKVTIELFELREVIRMKTGNGVDVFVEKRNWQELTTGALGKDIRAYRPDGKVATAQEVLKALVKPSGVAYFIGYDKNKAVEPDLFYLKLLKEGSVALAFDRPDLGTPVP
jgi:hypothetical protein